MNKEFLEKKFGIANGTLKRISISSFLVVRFFYCGVLVRQPLQLRFMIMRRLGKPLLELQC